MVEWLFHHIEGFSDRREARKYASNLLKAGFIRHTVNKITFSEQCYYVFGDLSDCENCESGDDPPGPRSEFSGEPARTCRSAPSPVACALPSRHGQPLPQRQRRLQRRLGPGHPGAAAAPWRLPLAHDAHLPLPAVPHARLLQPAASVPRAHQLQLRPRQHRQPAQRR